MAPTEKAPRVPGSPEVPDVSDVAKSMLVLYGPHDDHDHDQEPPGGREGPDTRYARQPLFPIDADAYDAMRAATQRDSNTYMYSGLAPVECRRCGTTVQVKKLGPGYTAVQWSSTATEQCAHFAEERTEGRTSSRSRSCPHMTASIRHAVAEGLLEEAPGAE